ncbi:hypothetical protein AB6A40_004326 [Gnathostoma spinigerum]|uniref:Strictosidine synthase conserved region domain-containing protein n=1 Tax=Gnathostoma spinigerum TaxID=75299 RepID=A0ABD6EM27_9BILA
MVSLSALIIQHVANIRRSRFDAMRILMELRSRLKRRSESEGPANVVDDKEAKKRSKRFITSWLLCWAAALVLISIVFFAIVAYPSKDKVAKYELPSRPSLKGPLAVNQKLKQAERLLQGSLIGPESLLVEGNKIYTGTQDGRILEIVDGKIERTLRLKEVKDGITCGTYDTEPICGRPLGIRRLNENELVIADAYLGIFILNFDMMTSKQIVEGGKMVAGAPLKFLNDIEVLGPNYVVFSHSSTRWDRRDFMKEILQGVPTGRVLSVDPSTGALRVLIEKLSFANGIQLSPDRLSLLVAETGMARIWRYHLGGPKAGKLEIFANNLPGLPDNIRLSSKGTFWVGMADVRRHGQFALLDFMSDKLYLRDVLLKITPNFAYSKLFPLFKARHALLIELNANGEIISSMHDLMGEVITDISQVTESNGYLYLGSYHAAFIGKIKL